ncbi:MAG: response regulator [Desulfobacterales bacterium]|jgi:PAS domain S-box-containing protein
MENLSQWKIVLIDDEEDIREVMAIALQDAGYKVDTAADGATGLQLCEGTSPQILITDIRMPGIDGLQVLETIKKKYPDIEVIVATAFGEMDLAIRALQLDASDFITKPISDEALYLALKRAKERFNSRKQLKDYTALLEKEKAETSQELLKSIAFQRNLIESSMDGILGCDNNNTVATYNHSMEQILGYPKEEVLHKMTFEQFFPAGGLTHFKAEMTRNTYGGKNRLILYETSLIEKSGREIPVQVSASLLFDQGRENGLVCFFRDLREIRKLEREVSDQARILHQDKMMSLGRLAASVVHEINNPLSGILNYLRLMSRILGQGALSEDRKEKFQRYLELVENETHRCSQIVSSLLSFSRISPPSFVNVQIDELLQRCILLSQHKLELSNIRLESSIPPDLPPVVGDFNQLQQCVINLIFNALDAMPEGGNLTLDSRLDGNRGRVIITVRDTGRGISSEHLPHIFEPFFTTKNEGYGVGLGLSTVYGIIERHKGDVFVESQPGEGTAIMLELPVSGSNKDG